jgi:hypothetical protein
VYVIDKVPGRLSGVIGPSRHWSPSYAPVCLRLPWAGRDFRERKEWKVRCGATADPSYQLSHGAFDWRPSLESICCCRLQVARRTKASS